MNLLVVDVQPGHSKHLGNILQEVLPLVSEADKTTWLFNGPGLGYDTADDVSYWLVEYTGDESVLDHVTFVEKKCGWARDWMDGGVAGETIVRGLRRAVELGSTLDSSNVGEDVELAECVSEYGDLGLPSDGVVEALSRLPDGVLVTGGGRNECLREVTLLLTALGKTWRLGPVYESAGVARLLFNW